jgi:hypothetical protein
MRCPDSLNTTASLYLLGVGIPSRLSTNDIAVGSCWDGRHTNSGRSYRLSSGRKSFYHLTPRSMLCCAVLAKGQLSNYSYRGEELTDPDLDLPLASCNSISDINLGGIHKKMTNMLTTKRVDQEQTPALAHVFNTHP